MIDRLLIFGGTGDLAARYLLPGLAALRNRSYLDDGFELIAASREELDDSGFRRWVGDQLDRHAAGLPREARDWVVVASRYHRADVTDPASVATMINSDRPVAAYLALPPAIFGQAVSALFNAQLPDGSSIVLEKPFGEHLSQAIELNSLLAKGISEDSVFRVDHFLAMTTVQNLLGTRLANRVFEPIWNSANIDEIEIVWDESLALEGRAGYYDGVGALKDMLQNHLLQLLCLVAMEPPVSLDARDLRNRKVDVLRSIRPLASDQVAVRSRRARYSQGSIGGRSIPAYVDEEGVDPQHQTETYAELELQVDNWRWAGTRFRLRTGKALRRDRMEVVVHFRPVPHLPAGFVGDPDANVLRFGLQPEGLAVGLTGVGSHAQSLVPLTLSAELEPPELPAYGRLLLDVLQRNAALSVRGDEAEESWRVMDPVITAWAEGRVPMEEYAAGSDGPEPR